METWMIAVVVAVLALAYAYSKKRRKKDDEPAPKPKPSPPKQYPPLPDGILVKPKSDVQGRGLTILLPRSQAGQYRDGSGYIVGPDGNRYPVWEAYRDHPEHNRDILYWRETFSGSNYVLFWNNNTGYSFNPGVRSGS